ncbi:MAG: AMP-binding protein, partial [Actinobacteria bacterium]|nr:AMP-binding protein [Actinomycetota bacterium]
IFTSGTAGAPRAAMLSHHNLLTNLQQLMQLSPLTQQDVVFGVLPLFHIFGLNVVLGLSMFVGASVVLVQRFDPVTALETFAERRVTVVPGAPPVWTALSQVPGINAASFSTVRLALTGASKMPEDITRMLADKCGVVVHEGYGLTEASPVISMSVDRTVHVGSIGHVLPGIELRLVDENGDDAESGDSGEIWVRGDNVFRGYLRDEEATSRVITPEGWLRTGDVAVRDDDGYLFLVDRVKDLIIVSGFNVYPAEVESVLNAHAAIAQSAVVGVAHPHTGEAVRAYVVLESGAYLDEESVIEWCQKHVARYKCPSKVLIVESLPTGGTGKVLRRALR